MPLKPQHRLFVSHYLKFGNATKAALAAGYSKKTARVQASALLSKPDIREAINKKVEKVIEKTDLSAAAVLAQIQKHAFANIKDAFDKEGKFLPLHEMPEEVSATLSGIETDELFGGRGKNKKKIGVTRKIKKTDSIRALELLAKHFKLLTDLHEIAGKDGGPLVVLTMPSNGSEAKEEE